MYKFNKDFSIFKTKDKVNYLIQILTNEELAELDYDIENNINDVEFNNKYNIIKKNIITYGKTDDITTKTLSRFIDKTITTHRVAGKINPSTMEETRKHYECFTIKDYINCNNPIHEDYLSSWNCLLQKYYTPKYIIIYTANKNLTFKEITDE